MPGVSRGGDAQRRQQGLRRQWPKVHQIDSPSPLRCTHVQVKRLGLLRPARSTVAHGAASCGAVGLWSRRDLALGCAGLYRASTRPAAGVRMTQLSGTQKRDMRWCGGVHIPCNRKARRDGRHTGSTRDVGEHTDMGLSKSTARGGAAAQPHNLCTIFHGATADPNHGPRTATAALKSMSGSGAPARRGTAVLRREGRHPGKMNRATRHDVAGASQEGDQGGGKKRTAVVVLTMGRRCRRSRLGEEGFAGEVDVHGDGLPRHQLLAPGPCSAPPARRGGGAPPLSALTQGRRNRKPQWGWWLGHLGFRPLPRI
jgi:hypothetical protein